VEFIPPSTLSQISQIFHRFHIMGNFRVAIRLTCVFKNADALSTDRWLLPKISIPVTGKGKYLTCFAIQKQAVYSRMKLYLSGRHVTLFLPPLHREFSYPM